MKNADLWFTNNFGGNAITPSTCAWMCREKGFTLSSNNWYSYHCRCGDKYGSHECDSNGYCGLPRLEDSNCKLPCHYSDRLQSCGGDYGHTENHGFRPRALAIYRTTGELYVDPSELDPIVCDSSDCINIYDGVNTVDWQSTGYSTSTITLKLKTSKRLSALRILWSIDGGYRAKTLTVSTRLTDGGTFVSRASTTDAASSLYQLIRFSSVDALHVQIEFTSPADSGTDYRLREMWLNYYESELHEDEVKPLSSSKLLSLENQFSKENLILLLPNEKVEKLPRL
jgi:hypothetical protein